jgi:putative transposase
MVWTEITREHHRRDGLRYASDLKDREWAVIAPLMPEPSRLGRPRVVDLRAVVNAILYILATGCQWRALPKDFPPRATVQGYF